MSPAIRVEVCPVDTTVRVTSPLTHLCPYRDEVDEGRVSISWNTTGMTLELHALRAWLDGFADTRVTHESLTDTIHFCLAQQRGIADVSVTSTWNTAGMEVSCSTSPTLAGRP